MPSRPNRLFVACTLSLVASAIGFVVRAFLLGELGRRFNLTETQLGSIQGAGLYPQAVTMILSALAVDRIGYKRAMAFGFGCHILSALILMTAGGYGSLYLGTFIFALAGGVVEGVINPVAATLYAKQKTHFLNILHAGWPGGMVLGGLVVVTLGSVGGEESWRWKIGLYLLPTLVYGGMMLREEFPVQERVAAGISYTDMLRECGWGGCLLICLFLGYAVDEILRVAELRLPGWGIALVTAVPTLLFALRIRNIGRPMFLLLMGVMTLLATTELGTDSWIADLMTPVLRDAGPNAGNWVLIYTSAIMFILRFLAGPIARQISPLGLLALSAAVASLGLTWLSRAGSSAGWVFLAATCYGVGKTFFWPTTLGVVSEQFPKGGALTLSSVSAVGLIAVGVIGSPFLGTLQDDSLDKRLGRQNPALLEKVAGPVEQKHGLRYRPVDKSKVAALPAAERALIDQAQAVNNQATLGRVALLPGIMLVCYLGLIGYFVRRGGYREVRLSPPSA
ncbi:MAG TPA: MFS transporter [Verrucomicrobiales bacterium]|nr:MFS transporter [Verrucomicrobiales bacterium]